MLCEFTVLRRSGMRLLQSEWPRPQVLTLEVRDWDGSSNNFKRHMRVANLFLINGGTRQTVATVFDPELLMTTVDALLIRGTEVEVINKRTHEFVQMWLCRPTIYQGAPLKPFDTSIPAFGQP